MDSSRGGYSAGWTESCKWLDGGRPVPEPAVRRAFAVLWTVLEALKHRVRAAEFAAVPVQCARCHRWRGCPRARRAELRAAAEWTCAMGAAWQPQAPPPAPPSPPASPRRAPRTLSPELRAAVVVEAGGGRGREDADAVAAGEVCSAAEESDLTPQVRRKRGLGPQHFRGVASRRA